MEQNDGISPCERDQACPLERSATDRQDVLRHGLSVAMAGVSASASPRVSVDDRRTLLGEVPSTSEALRDPSTLASDDGVAYRTRSHGPPVRSVDGPRTYGPPERSADGPQAPPLCMGTQGIQRGCTDLQDSPWTVRGYTDIQSGPWAVRGTYCWTLRRCPPESSQGPLRRSADLQYGPRTVREMRSWTLWRCPPEGSQGPLRRSADLQYGPWTVRRYQLRAIHLCQCWIDRDSHIGTFHDIRLWMTRDAQLRTAAFCLSAPLVSAVMGHCQNTYTAKAIQSYRINHNSNRCQ